MVGIVIPEEGPLGDEVEFVDEGLEDTIGENASWLATTADPFEAASGSSSDGSPICTDWFTTARPSDSGS